VTPLPPRASAGPARPVRAPEARGACAARGGGGGAGQESASRWETRPADEAQVDGLAREAGLPRPAARVLVARGIAAAADAELFLNPRLSALSDPCSLPGMETAAARIERAVARGERIAVFADYDVDGVTGAVLLRSVLEKLGANARWFFPERERDGYGFTPGALARCLDRQGPGLIVTVDCGINAAESVGLAAARGADTIVTDHHAPGAALPPAVAVVNPLLWPEGAFRELAGVGTAFKLCHALVKRGLRRGDSAAAAIDLRAQLDLVAVGTVADVCPLTGENRVLVRHGLERVAGRGRAGLTALLEIARLKGGIDPYHVSFVIGPRLNAAGRLGLADDAADLLYTGDAARAAELGRRLDAANAERKRIEDEILGAALADVEARFDAGRDFGLVSGGAGWHPGVIGIVASRICERFLRPAAVIGFDGRGAGRGSCRGVAGLDLVGALEECADLLTGYGGHAMAAGLTLDEDRFGAFAARFNEVCARRLAGRDLRRAQAVDAWLDLGEADAALFKAIGRMQPFGVGNPAPVWGAKALRFVERPRVVGGGHLKGLLASGGAQMEMIGFGMGGRAVPEGPLDVLFQLQENAYMGRTALQMKVKDFRPSEIP